MHSARDTTRAIVPPLLAACVVALIIGDPGTGSDVVTLPSAPVATAGR